MYPFIDFFSRQIPTYGLCMVIAIFFVGGMALVSTEREAVSCEDILIVSAGAVLSGLLGGFLLYLCVTYSVSDILKMLRIGDYSFLRGGLVFYGALIGGVLGGLLCVRLTGASLLAVERCIVPYIPFGHAIGRIGCVLAGCCTGTPYDGPCALYYPNSLFGLDPDQGYFPVQLLEAVINIAIGVYLLWFRKRTEKKFELLISYLGLYGIARFFLEFLRGDRIRGFAGGFSTSQWVSLLLLSICLVFRIISRCAGKKEK